MAFMDLQETKDGLSMLCIRLTSRSEALGKDWPWMLFIATCFVTAMAANATAQLPGTQLRSLFPPGGQRGTAIDVRIVGADLDDVHGLQNDGMACEHGD